MSTITNFGCHYTYPYYIAEENNIHIPVTTLEELDSLDKMLYEDEYNIISVPGGGDPLHHYEEHVDWCRKLFKITREYASKHSLRSTAPIPIEMYTSYMTGKSSFPFYDCYRVAYHANTYEQLEEIQRTESGITRIVYVVIEDFSLSGIMNIAILVKGSSNIDELSFRRLVDNNHESQHYLEDYLKLGRKKLWHYIEQNNYNLYYTENKVSYRYEDFKIAQEI